MCHNSICTKKDTDCTDGTDFHFIKRIVYQIITSRLKNVRSVGFVI